MHVIQLFFPHSLIPLELITCFPVIFPIEHRIAIPAPPYWGGSAAPGLTGARQIPLKLMHSPVKTNSG